MTTPPVVLIQPSMGERPPIDPERFRYASRSTLVTSQLPLAQWHELLGDPTLADAILDRLVHNAYKLELKGGSMRKHHSALTHADHCTA